jgi:hypothetical protein
MPLRAAGSGPAARPASLGRSLPACTKCCGATARTRRVREDQLAVSGTLGMEGQSGIILAARAQQRVHDLGVNGCFSVRGNGSLYRDSCNLMAESKIIFILDQQTVADQLIYDERIVDQRDQQRGLHPGTDQCGSVEHIASRRAQRPGMGENGIANRRRQGVAASLQHLGDEEGVAGGQPV